MKKNEQQNQKQVKIKSRKDQSKKWIFASHLKVNVQSSSKILPDIFIQ